MLLTYAVCVCVWLAANGHANRTAHHHQNTPVSVGEGSRA